MKWMILSESGEVVVVVVVNVVDVLIYSLLLMLMLLAILSSIKSREVIIASVHTFHAHFHFVKRDEEKPNIAYVRKLCENN